MFEKSYITEHFKIINNQKIFDLKEELSWGFYFSNKDKELLNIACKHALLNIYDFIEVIYCDDLYHLQVAKNEIHTEESLFQRCNELYEFSKSLGIDSFNGFDVEEI